MSLASVHEEISVTFLAETLGIGERWVQSLTKDGVLVKNGHGRYDLAASVQAYIKFKIESEVARATPAETSPGERVKTERARKLKLENDERELQLVAMPDAIAALDVIVGPLKADLAGGPARATDDVAMRRKIENAIEPVLSGLADRFVEAGEALRTGRDPYSSDEEDNG